MGRLEDLEEMLHCFPGPLVRVEYVLRPPLLLPPSIKPLFPLSRPAPTSLHSLTISTGFCSFLLILEDEEEKYGILIGSRRELTFLFHLWRTLREERGIDFLVDLKEKMRERIESTAALVTLLKTLPEAIEE
ncbi:MAG: hypothetical protein QXJ59_04435 [Thermofilaceae archaeon]